MSQQQPKEKAGGYINVQADISLLNAFMCCTQRDMHKNNEADTPRAQHRSEGFTFQQEVVSHPANPKVPEEPPA